LILPEFVKIGLNQCQNCLFDILRQVWLMQRFAEKLGFMKVRTVKVCTKTGFGRSREHNNPGFCADFRINRLKENKP